MAEKKPFMGDGSQSSSSSVRCGTHASPAVPCSCSAHSSPCAGETDQILFSGSWKHSEQHQTVPFSSPLCWSSPAQTQHGGEESAGCCAAPCSNKSPAVCLAAQQQVELAVSAMMRIDVTHQVLVPELIQIALGFCEAQRREFLNCLIPQGHQSTLKGQEYWKATRSWCNQLWKAAERIKPQCLALTGRGGAGMGRCLLRWGKCKIDFLLHLTCFSLSSPILLPFVIKFKNNSNFEIQTCLNV